MDTGEGYHGDIEFKVSIAKHLSGDIVLNCYCGNWVSSCLFPPYGDISLGLEKLGGVMRNHYDAELKKKFLEWVSEPLR